MIRILLALLLALAGTAHAEDVILPPDDFLASAFGGAPPPARTLWVTGELRESAQAILGHPPSSLRVRYWQDSGRSAWILEAIGKESPITAGFVVENGELREAEVLIYRESRGGEIRFPSFLRQFPGLRLDESGLSGHVDNISSATLSVNAMKKMAALALLLASRS